MAQAFASAGGGNAANTLTALAKLGARTALLTKLGDDLHGEAILAELGRDGVDTSRVVVARGAASPSDADDAALGRA